MPREPFQKCYIGNIAPTSRTRHVSIRCKVGYRTCKLYPGHEQWTVLWITLEVPLDTQETQLRRVSLRTTRKFGKQVVSLHTPVGGKYMYIGSPMTSRRRAKKGSITESTIYTFQVRGLGVHIDHLLDNVPKSSPLRMRQSSSKGPVQCTQVAITRRGYMTLE